MFGEHETKKEEEQFQQYAGKEQNEIQFQQKDLVT